MEAEAGTCSLTCIGQPEPCLTNCIVTATGTSVWCAGCFAEQVGCVFTNCLAQCGAEPKSGACQQCQYDTGCYAAFETCSGETTPGPCEADCGDNVCGDDGCGGSCGECEGDTVCNEGACTAPVTDACIGESDQAIITDPTKDVVGNTGTCGSGCLGQPDTCTADCLVTATGLSSDCAGCYAASFGCAVVNCALQCFDPTTPECAQCQIDSGCTAAFEACAGQPGSCPEGESLTCTPIGCEDGIDNAMAGMAGLANSSLQGALDDGSLNYLMEFKGFPTDGAFTIALHRAQLDSESESGECDVSAATCGWEVEDSSFQPDCSANGTLSGVTLAGDSLNSTPAIDTTFKFELPTAGLPLAMPIGALRMEATVSTDAGGNITLITGILAGGIVKADLIAAVDDLPDEGLPISKDAIKNILSNVVKADLDLVGDDGVKESASIGVLFEAVPGTIGDTIATGAAVCAEIPATDGTPTFRLTKLKLGESGKSGQGLDVDGFCE